METLNKKSKKITIVKSAYFKDGLSVIEMDVAPKAGNPKHYHSLFAESFEVLEGELFIGKGSQTMTLTKGEKVVVERGVTHYFKNKTDNVCKIRVTLQPSNLDFEDAMLIYYGLLEDGLTNKSGAPKNLYDLALFVTLNNSKMKGIGKLAQYFFGWMAQKARKSGRLEELKAKYCKRF